MALEFRDRTADTTTTTGTGTLTLLGAAPTGFRAFSAAGHTSGCTVRYSIVSADRSEWEVGEGVWTSSGNTLTRDTVYASSNANALVNFSAGTKDVTEVMAARTAESVSHAIDKASVRLDTVASDAPGTGNGWAKFPFDTVDFDTAAMWNVPNLRFAPSRAGYYLVTLRVALAGSGSLNVGAARIAAAVVKNNTTYYYAGAYPAEVSIGGTNGFAGGTVMVYLNGTTDYIEGFMNVLAVRRRSAVLGEQYMQITGPL